MVAVFDVDMEAVSVITRSNPYIDFTITAPPAPTSFIDPPELTADQKQQVPP